jgi:prevent-host-death family protein
LRFLEKPLSILVMLTRKSKSRKLPASTWKLQDAKARFSEIVRRAQTEGPQHVTVHGKDAVVIVSADEYAKRAQKKGGMRTGADLVAAMQQAGKLGLKLKPVRFYPTFRPPVSFADDDR